MAFELVRASFNTRGSRIAMVRIPFSARTRQRRRRGDSIPNLGDRREGKEALRRWEIIVEGAVGASVPVWVIAEEEETAVGECTGLSLKMWICEVDCGDVAMALATTKRIAVGSLRSEGCGSGGGWSLFESPGSGNVSITPIECILNDDNVGLRAQWLGSCWMAEWKLDEAVDRAGGI
ncbi:hypothetical protein CPC08DRAFT_728090 [Agrocybe pediades]|nr:hypothetical protein CPC08DRAFT_728090 [Agrocybe pediades]